MRVVKVNTDVILAKKVAYLDGELPDFKSREDRAQQTEQFRIRDHRIPLPRNIKVLSNESTPASCLYLYVA